MTGRSLTRWLEAVRGSWGAHRRLLTGNLVAASALCAVMAWLGRRVGWGALYFFTDFRDGERYTGLMTVLSAACLAACGWSFLTIGRLARRSPAVGAEPRAWLWAAVGLVTLAYDELVMVHEWWSERLAGLGLPGLLGDVDGDVYTFGAYALAAIVVGARLVPAILETGRATAPLAIAVACFAISQGLDFVPWDSLTRTQQEIVGPLEEGFKTVGSWMMAVFGLLLAEDRAEAAARGPAM